MRVQRSHTALVGGRQLSSVQEAQQQQAGLEREYGSLSNPQVVSLAGFAAGPVGKLRHRTGLLGTTTFGEAEMRALAQAQAQRGLAC